MKTEDLRSSNDKRNLYYEKIILAQRGLGSFSTVDRSIINHSRHNVHLSFTLNSKNLTQLMK